MTPNDEARPPGAGRRGAGGTGRQQNAGRAHPENSDFPRLTRAADQYARDNEGWRALAWPADLCAVCGTNRATYDNVHFFDDARVVTVVPLCGCASDWTAARERIEALVATLAVAGGER